MFAPPAAARRRARKLGQLRSVLGVDTAPSVIESPNVTIGRRVRGSDDIDVRQEVIRLRGGCIRDHGRGRGVAFLGDIRRMQSNLMHRVRRSGVRNEDAYRKIARGRHVQIHRVADLGGARRNPARRFAAKEQRAIRWGKRCSIPGREARCAPRQSSVGRSRRHLRAPRARAALQCWCARSFAPSGCGSS